MSYAGVGFIYRTVINYQRNLGVRGDERVELGRVLNQRCHC